MRAAPGYRRIRAAGRESVIVDIPRATRRLFSAMLSPMLPACGIALRLNSPRHRASFISFDAFFQQRLKYTTRAGARLQITDTSIFP